ncbi:MAG TPA: [FeFe] hydrogenase H-cluster radical SAM maturase HydE [Candidatus Rifleibacterium sp.]|nr:[FeFe] hydrogenase H-cluster radical SAM maturase HydE [Candidatus Rifleibacterium sp.]HPT46018.1 [FeFe] hydrogenase H-cluster radical SAM maturase HydE [Candidatus Rifleibacterium sp.]
MPDKLLARAEQTGDLTLEEIEQLLGLEKPEELEKLFAAAYAVKTRFVGRVAWFRGLVEMSNICSKDCYYCGIRRSNTHTDRYLIPEEDVIKSAVWAWQAEYGSAVLQAGERSDPEFIAMVERIISEIRLRTNGELGLTLSLGEQSEETYRRWFAAGAHRYLLRIETSNPELYRKLHPADHSYDERLECLNRLRRAGFMVGTGVMVGLPFQNLRHLAEDVMFFKGQDVDMIGMGPYIYHNDTPLAAHRSAWEIPTPKLLNLGLKMIAVTRLVLRDVNIASTTALQALQDNGRELGLLAGANVIMPNTTETQYRANYQLYENKPCLDENASMCRGCLQRRIEAIGEKIGFGGWGDSPHYARRRANTMEANNENQTTADFAGTVAGESVNPKRQR